MFLITIDGKTGHFYYLFNHFSSGQKKLEKGSLSFHPKNMKNISKCSQNSVVSKATSIFLHYVPDFFNKSLIKTFLFVSV